ncbi:MAG TPA: universal stress protein, partial [Verrucomicrobiae bacterium]|nr:universal stress protein [Verrucomicrobiae bacterium]
MKMLICSDGSEAAEKAIQLGAAIAAAANAEVTLLGLMDTAEKADAVREALKRGQELLERHNLHAEVIVKSGEAVGEIAKKTGETSYDLVVIGAARKATSGRLWMPTNIYKIIKSIQPPVLVAMEKTETLKRVLVCSGSQEYNHATVAVTGQIARGMGASVTLFHVVPEPPAMYSGLHRMELNVDSVLNSKSLLGR